MIEGFAESTIDATRHNILHAPENLPAWLACHERPKLLEKIARQLIAEEAERKGNKD